LNKEDRKKRVGKKKICLDIRGDGTKIEREVSSENVPFREANSLQIGTQGKR